MAAKKQGGLEDGAKQSRHPRTAIEVALELEQCKHITTRKKEPCQETHESRVGLGGHTGSLSVQPKISTSHFAWLSVEESGKRGWWGGCVICSQHSCRQRGREICSSGHISCMGAAAWRNPPVHLTRSYLPATKPIEPLHKMKSFYQHVTASRAHMGGEELRRLQHRDG